MHWDDVNAQARTWCDTVANALVQRAIGRMSATAWEEEKCARQPLPPLVPPGYALSNRVVDTQGYIALESSSHSMPDGYLAQTVAVYQCPDDLQISHRPQTLANHPRDPDQA